MSVRMERGYPILTDKQVEAKRKADRILVNSLIDQVEDMRGQLADLDTSYDLLKTKTSRSIGSLKDSISWLKAWSAGITIVMFIYMLGDVLGAW